MRSAKKGQPWKPPRASDQNAIASTVNAHIRGGGVTPEREAPIAGTIIKVKNESGSAMRRGDVLALSRTNLLASVMREYPWIGADKLSAAGRESILAALIDPLADDEIGDAQLLGVAAVYVTVGATWHRRARPTTSADVLVSSLFGPVELLITPASTGEQYCLCSIGHADNRGLFALTTSSITAASLSSGRLVLGSGTATIFDPYASTVGQYESSGHSATIYNMAGDAVASGGYVQIVPTDDWLPLANLDPCTQPA